MGKDQSKDENAATKNRDHSRDQDTWDVSLAKTIARGSSPADPSYRRCVSKADGGDMCAV